MALLEMKKLTPKHSISLHRSGQRYPLPTPAPPPRLAGTLTGSGLQYPSSTMHNKKHVQPREEKTPPCLPGLSRVGLSLQSCLNRGSGSYSCGAKIVCD